MEKLHMACYYITSTMRGVTKREKAKETALQISINKAWINHASYGPNDDH